jgi:hypothetical protein
MNQYGLRIRRRMALRPGPAYMVELLEGAMRLAAAYDLDRTWTLR